MGGRGSAQAGGEGQPAAPSPAPGPNAGNFEAGYFEELAPEQMERQLATTLVGPMKVTRAVLPPMRIPAPGEHVVTISSSAGFTGVEFGSAYAASKWGVEGWMESLAPEVEPFGIHTTIVNPGFFRTELLTKESTNYAGGVDRRLRRAQRLHARVLGKHERQAGRRPWPSSPRRCWPSSPRGSRRSASSPAPTRSKRPRRSSPSASSRSTPSATSRPRWRSTRR